MTNNEEKLALNESLDKSYENSKKVALDSLLKFGKVSIPYLMRKLKCTKLTACKIMEDLEIM
jgi:hypothetical protein